MTESTFFHIFPCFSIFFLSSIFSTSEASSDSDDGGPRLTSVPWNVFSSSELQTFNIRFFHLVLFSACTYMVCMSEVHMFKNTWLLLSPELKCQTIGQDCSGAQMTINGRSRVTSVRWVFVAIILTLPASEQSIWWPFDFYIFIQYICFVSHLAGVLTMGVPSSLGGLAVVSILLLPFKSTHWLKGSGNY